MKYDGYNMLQIKQLSKRYAKAEQYALQNVSLHIKQGSFFGLLGPNGCGKTTLISMITGLLQPTSGEILLNDEPLNRQSKRQSKKLKALIGLVPQELALYPTLSLKQNLNFFGKLYGLQGQQLKQRVQACIELAHLQEFIHRPIQNYSGGMKRRANLVLGLLHQPRILILDEPTVHVDPQSRQVIFDILADLHQQGVTIIFTTHYMEEAQQCCEQVAIMDSGRLVSCDSPAVLINRIAHARNLEDVFLELTGRHLRDSYA